MPTDVLTVTLLRVAVITWALVTAMVAHWLNDTGNDSPHSKWLARRTPPLPHVLAILEASLWPLALVLLVVLLIASWVGVWLHDLARRRS